VVIKEILVLGKHKLLREINQCKNIVNILIVFIYMSLVSLQISFLSVRADIFYFFFTKKLKYFEIFKFRKETQ